MIGGGGGSTRVGGSGERKRIGGSGGEKEMEFQILVLKMAYLNYNNSKI